MYITHTCTHMYVPHIHIYIYTSHTHPTHIHAKIIKINITKEHRSLVTLRRWRGSGCWGNPWEEAGAGRPALEKRANVFSPPHLSLERQFS